MTPEEEAKALELADDMAWECEDPECCDAPEHIVAHALQDMRDQRDEALKRIQDGTKRLRARRGQYTMPAEATLEGEVTLAIQDYWCPSPLGGISVRTHGGELNGHRLEPVEMVRADLLEAAERERDEAKAGLASVHRAACRGDGHASIKSMADCAVSGVHDLKESLAEFERDLSAARAREAELADILSADRHETLAHAASWAVARIAELEREAVALKRSNRDAAAWLDRIGMTDLARRVRSGEWR